MNRKIKTALGLAAVSLATSALTSPTFAAAQYISIPPEDLGHAIKDFARTTSTRVIVASDLVAGKRSAGTVGAYTPDLALAAILFGSGLHAELVAGAYVVRRDGPVARVEANAPSADKDIVVTGTRIHGEAPIGTPLTVVDRKAIETSGRATVADYIQTLPQNYGGGANEGNVGISPHGEGNIGYGSGINLRGLGSESTLVLFDGNRPAVGGNVGAFVDMTLIPAGAIERIEILTDGASAIYGTDAVAGVVNVRFRNREQGFETHLYSGTAGRALSQFQAGQTAGKRWSSGSLFFAYQYDQRRRLAGDSRAVSTQDLRRFGGPDLRDPYSVPGTLIAADGEIFGIPNGQDGRHLAPADLIPGQANLTDTRRTVDLLPEQKTHSIYGAFDQTLFSDVSLYAHALYARRSFKTRVDRGTLSPETVPVSNPFYVDPIGTGEPVSVNYDFTPELGADTTAGRLSAITSSAGLKATPGPWTFDLAGSYGHESDTIDEYDALSNTRIAIALADPDPTTALNLFGDGHANNPETLAFIRARYRPFVRSTMWSAAFRADGPLFHLPAGTVKLATGFEHRHESFSSGYYYDASSPTPGDFSEFITAGTPGERHIDAVYGELSVPIWNGEDGGFPGRLDASLAGRLDWYSDVGRTANPKAGLSWTPTPGLTLRGSWGTSFRAPSFNENAGTSQNHFIPYLAPDPSSPTGTRPVMLITGYADTIRPEKATSWTAGLDLKPDLVPGLTFGATYFNIDYRDRIAQPATDLPRILVQPDVYASLIASATPEQIAAYYASPQLEDFYGLSPDTIHTILHLEIQNLSRVTVRGIDFHAAFAHAIAGGTGTIGVDGTRLIAMKQKLTSASPGVEVLGLLYSPVRWRLRGHAGWEEKRLSADAFVNYTGGYLNNQISPTETVANWTSMDAQIAYRFQDHSPLRGARIALSATNLLNTRPPYVLNSTFGRTVAFDPGQASAIGRLVSLDLTFQW